VFPQQGSEKKMDIYCAKCGEPWEMDTLHEEADESGRNMREVWADFRKNGCQALGARCGDGYAPEALSVLSNLLGDDIDGYAAVVEDLTYQLRLEEI
jgi:hypothetical protein